MHLSLTFAQFQAVVAALTIDLLPVFEVVNGRIRRVLLIDGVRQDASLKFIQVTLVGELPTPDEFLAAVPAAVPVTRFSV